MVAAGTGTTTELGRSGPEMGRWNPKFWPEVENDAAGRAWRTVVAGRAWRTAVEGRAWKTAVAGRSSRSMVGRKWADGEREGKNGGNV